MAWYRPSSWSRKNTEENPVILRCDNSQCNGIIDSHAAYLPELGKIYHPGDCQITGLCHLLLESDDTNVILANFKSVSLKKALKLYHKGKLRQADSASDSLPQA